MLAYCPCEKLGTGTHLTYIVTELSKKSINVNCRNYNKLLMAYFEKSDSARTVLLPPIKSNTSAIDLGRVAPTGIQTLVLTRSLSLRCPSHNPDASLELQSLVPNTLLMK